MSFELVIVIAVIAVVLVLRQAGRRRSLEPPPRCSHRLPPSFDAQGAKPAFQVLKGRAYIIDGDTVTIKKTQIRLFGIDAPEMNHPYGKKAKWALLALCKGQVIRAEISEKDAHGRTVAKCFLPDGRDLSAEMVKQGLAIDWPKFSGGFYREFETADARKKLWLADARQKGRMHVWEEYEARQNTTNVREARTPNNKHEDC